MRARPSVILIREWEQQLSGGRCCGGFEGRSMVCQKPGAAFPDRRAIMERMGAVYRSLKKEFGDRIDVQIVDPRNVALIFVLIRDFWVFRVGLGAALRTLFGASTEAVVVNGRLVDRAARTDPERIAALVRVGR